MTRAEHLLTTLAEECNETAQRCTKALRFGLSEVQSGQSLTNGERILGEYAHIVAMMDVLVLEGYIARDPDIGDVMAEKKRQFERYYDYSKSIGRVEP